MACFCTLLLLLLSLLWIQNRLAGKHGHSIWVAMFVSNMYGTQNMHWTWLHTCPSRFFIFYYLKFLKNDRHVGDTCPKKKDSWNTLYLHTNLLPLLFLTSLQQPRFLDLFIFYNFPPLFLFPCFFHLTREELISLHPPTWTKDVNTK